MEYLFFAGGMIYFLIFLLGFFLIPVLYLLTGIITISVCTYKEIKKR